MAAADFDRQIAVTERSTYGLPADAATLDALSVPGIDVGTAKYGFPLTAEEDRQLDLNGRIYFAERASRSVMPFVRALPTYAGAYIDQLDGGSLVVLLTSLDPATVAEIGARSPADRRKVRVMPAKYSERALRAGLNELRATWDDSSAPLVGAGLDVRGNNLYATVVAGDLRAAQTKAAAFAMRLGLPVDVRVGRPAQDVVCPDRDHCHTPLRAGERVRAGGPNTNNLCTMGFHIVDGGDEQWLTAGHCGCLFNSQEWFNTGFGKIGNEIDSLHDKPGDNIDIMSVQMADAQASELVIFDTGDITSPDRPIQGETIRASLGRTNALVSGTVTDSIDTWTSTFCNVVVYGADSSITAQTGDSGSPLYRKWTFGGETFITPLGIVDTSVGHFGFVEDAVDFWGATMYGG